MQMVNPNTPVKSIAYIVIALLSAVTLGAEPLASALVDLFIAFGGAMNDAQQEALITVVRIVAQLLISAGIVKVATDRQEAAVTPVANPSLPVGSTVNVIGSEDKVVIESSPPGPTGIEGDGTAGPGEVDL